MVRMPKGIVVNAKVNGKRGHASAYGSRSLRQRADARGGRPSRDGIEKRCMPALKAPFVFARRCVARLAKERENFVRERVGRRSRTCTYSIAVGLASVFESLDRSPSAEVRGSYSWTSLPDSWLACSARRREESRARWMRRSHAHVQAHA